MWLPSPAELKYFLEVAETGNISRAAERLGITQPTLSLAIRRLEDNLGTPLLVRNKVGVRLTRSGEKLLAQGKLLLREWERIADEARRDEVEIRGRYSIGCHVSVALYALAKVVPALLESHPQVELLVAHDLSRKITEDVISFKLDFGIVVNPWDHPDLVIKELCRDEVTLWCAPRPSALQRASGEGAVLICDPELLQTQALAAQLERRKIRFARSITSSSLEVIASLVAAGAGVGILPARVAEREGGTRLRRWGRSAPVFHDRHCLVYGADAQRSAANRALARFLEARLKDPSPSRSKAGKDGAKPEASGGPKAAGRAIAESSLSGTHGSKLDSEEALL